MKYDEEKKKAIILYLLEKIEQNEESVSRTVSRTFSINQNTVHTYINRLAEAGIIRRVRRGRYELVKREYIYGLKRAEGDLDTDTKAYDLCLQEHICGFASNVQSIWNYVFSEMINNVMDHSMAENVRIRIAQDYLNTSAVIEDDGVGIFKKIREYFGYSSLDDAICELFKGKLTTDSKNHSGEGIFFSARMMDDFYIVSDGKIFTCNKYGADRVADLAAAGGSGTAVFMKLSNFTHKTPQEIFDRYADVDGGFTKTRIPLKNIFAASPVSRSQAKRVCNRLEKFKKVELDFEGLEWMGQGFAHQIFVTFREAHPEIALLPINMNEDVLKMYRHVAPADAEQDSEK